MTSTEREQQILDLIAPRLKAEGYTVFAHPSRQVLPAFMRDYSPDAIALGKPKNLAIEILQDQRSSSHERKQIAERFRGVSDWEIRVFYASEFADELVIEGHSHDLIEATLTKVQVLSDADQPEAALLLGWAAFEAFGRSLLPEKRSYPQSSNQLLERLAGDGVVTPEEADVLRRIASLRNAVAHGALNIDVEPRDVSQLITILRCALDEVRSDPAATNPSL